MKLKKAVLTFLAFVSATSCLAQFKLTGNILNYNGKQELIVNIPLVYGFHQENSLKIPIKNDGSFQINLPIKDTKFANLVLNNFSHTILLQPNKNLALHLNQNDKSINFLSGTALPENKLMQQIDFRGSVFFLNDHSNDKKDYTHFTYQNLLDSVMFPYLKQQDQKIKILNESKIDEIAKQIIADDINFRSAYFLDVFARVSNLKHEVMDSLILKIFENYNLSPKFTPSGSFYYNSIESYLKYIETKAFLTAKQENIADNKPLPYYDISLDSAKSLIKQNGKPFFLWIGATKSLPLKTTERFIYQQIANLYTEKNLSYINPLAEAFKNQFSTSIYIKDIIAKVTTLKEKLQENENNKNIVIIKNYEKLSSIADVIKSFKGNVVYLDIWGTWCGPCKEELQYVPELKAKFKDKDVVFVYLDMDPDEKDIIWREFIKVNELTGTHLRKNQQTIDPFWKELLINAQDKTRYYPQYFIFDKGGKLVVVKAKRPSDKEELYQQLNEYLD